MGRAGTAGLAAAALLLSCCLLLAATTTEAQVLGVDFGSETFKLSAVRPGRAIDIVLNEQSKRKTPSLVAFREGERFVGESAVAVAGPSPLTHDTWRTATLPQRLPHL